ncbi:transmembrane protein 121B-like [Haliotis cracherodii]|uniref:transmembrane protein 121B-like n=1 Tax=Haliotis cracherodii TaxID=6455 RepID=UPI0039E988BE
MDVNPYKRCDACYLIPTRVLCIGLVILQGAIIDYYLVQHNNSYWFAWIAADVALIFIFIMAFLFSYRHLQLVKSTSNEQAPVRAGSLPLGFFAWFVYSIILAVRVGIIFKNFAWKLKEEDFFGPNTLKIAVALSALVFVLLLLSHHDAPPKSERQKHIDILTQTVVFDILDSVDVLDVFFEKENVDALKILPGLDWGIICIACANLIIPTLPLMALSRIHFGYKFLPETLETLHKMLLLLVINTPLFTLRLILWHRLDQDVSTFIMKNFLVIGLVIYDFYNKGRFRRMHGGTDETDGAKKREMEEIMLRDHNASFDKSLQT